MTQIVKDPLRESVRQDLLTRRWTSFTMTDLEGMVELMEDFSFDREAVREHLFCAQNFTRLAPAEEVYLAPAGSQFPFIGRQALGRSEPRQLTGEKIVRALSRAAPDLVQRLRPDGKPKKAKRPKAGKKPNTNHDKEGRTLAPFPAH